NGGGLLGNDGIVDLDTGGNDGVIVDLFGEDGAIADVELGITDDDGGGVLDLGGGTGLINLDTEGEDGVILDLFGEGSAVADVELPLGGGSNGLLGGGTDVELDLFGPDVDDTATGGIPPVAD